MPGSFSISFDDEPVMYDSLEVVLCDQHGKELTPRVPVDLTGNFKFPPARERQATSAWSLSYYSTITGKKNKEVTLPARRMVSVGDEFDQSMLL